MVPMPTILMVIMARLVITPLITPIQVLMPVVRPPMAPTVQPLPEGRITLIPAPWPGEALFQHLMAQEVPVRLTIPTLAHPELQGRVRELMVRQEHLFIRMDAVRQPKQPMPQMTMASPLQ